MSIRDLALRLVAMLGLALAGASAFASDARKAASSGPMRVLFVGNSLTYVGDLPGTISTLAAAQGRSIRTEAILGPGAQIAQHAERGLVQRHLATESYDWLVLQEQGGSLLCTEVVLRRMNFDCAKARAAHRELVHAAHARGTRTVLLGTYNSTEQGARQLQTAESALQLEAGADAHAPIALAFARGLASEPDAEWFVSVTDFHPGRDTTMLMALSLYREIFGSDAVTAPVRVSARKFHANTSMDPAALLSSRRPLPGKARYTLPPARLAALTALLEQARSAAVPARAHRR